MSLRRFLIIALSVMGIVVAAVLLFLAGDHDEGWNSAPAPAAHGNR